MGGRSGGFRLPGVRRRQRGFRDDRDRLSAAVKALLKERGHRVGGPRSRGDSGTAAMRWCRTRPAQGVDGGRARAQAKRLSACPLGRRARGVKSAQPNSHQSSSKAAADQNSAARQPDASVVAARGRWAEYANGCGTSPVISRNRSACWSRNAFMAASKRAASARVFSGPETHTSSGFAPAVDGLCPSACSWARADTRAECPT